VQSQCTESTLLFSNCLRFSDARKRQGDPDYLCGMLLRRLLEDWQVKLSGLTVISTDEFPGMDGVSTGDAARFTLNIDDTRTCPPTSHNMSATWLWHPGSARNGLWTGTLYTYNSTVKAQYRSDATVSTDVVGDTRSIVDSTVDEGGESDAEPAVAVGVSSPSRGARQPPESAWRREWAGPFPPPQWATRTGPCTMGKAAVFAPPPDVQVVYGDGNCFFRALALYSNAALRLAKRSAKGVAEEPEFRTIEDTEAHAMRLDIAQYIVEHPDRDTLFLGLTYEGTEVTTFDAYAAAMRNSGPGNRFAGEYEVLAASGVLHVPIVVHDVVNRVSHKYGASAANTQMRDTGIGRTLHVQYIPDAENPHLSHYNLYVTNLAVAAHDLFPLPPAEWDRCSAEDQLRWQELGWDIKCGWLDQQLPSAYRGKRATDYRRLRYDNRKAYLALRGSATLWTAHCAAVRAIKRPYTDQKAVHNQKTCQDCGRSAAAQTSLKRWRRLCLCQGLERLLCSTCIVKQTSPLTGEKCTANEKKARDSVAGGAAPCLGAQHEARLNMVGEPWTTEAEALKAAGKPTRDPHGPSTGVSEYDDADDVVDGSQWDDTPQVAGERPAGSAQPHSAPAPPWSDLVRIMKTPECQSDLRTMADDHKDPKDHLQCTWSEWATLVPGSMVNDAPLFLWLKHRFNADVLASNALLVTNQLYSLLRDSPNNDAHTWFKSKPTTTASLIFVPIHAYFHYFLAVIDATKKEIVFWDSLAEEPEHDPVSGLRKNKKTTEFDLLLKWLKEEHEQKGVAFDLSEWKALEKQQDGPQQELRTRTPTAWRPCGRKSQPTRGRSAHIFQSSLCLLQRRAQAPMRPSKHKLSLTRMCPNDRGSNRVLFAPPEPRGHFKPPVSASMWTMVAAGAGTGQRSALTWVPRRGSGFTGLASVTAVRKAET